MELVVGHRKKIEEVKKALTGERPPHAMLFVGREGIGKKRVAMLAACTYLCQQGSGCLACRNCKRVLDGVHPDFRMEEAQGKSISIKQIRELREWAFMSPMEGKRKVAIIDNAHLMGHEAANALLKTLEEPPEGTLFILITSEPSRLLPTIVSRCQVVRFSPLKKEEVEEICTKEGVREEIKELCIETGSLMFLSTEPEKVKAAREVAEGILKNPSLSFMSKEEVWKDQETFMIFLYLLRRRLNRKLKENPWNTPLLRIEKRLREVEKLAYGSNVNLRSLYELVLLEVA